MWLMKIGPPNKLPPMLTRLVGLGGAATSRATALTVVAKRKGVRMAKLVQADRVVKQTGLATDRLLCAKVKIGVAQNNTIPPAAPALVVAMTLPRVPMMVLLLHLPPRLDRCLPRLISAPTIAAC